LEVNGKKLTSNYTLSQAVSARRPGEIIKLKVLHKGSKKAVSVKLEEMPN